MADPPTRQAACHTRGRGLPGGVQSRGCGDDAGNVRNRAGAARLWGMESDVTSPPERAAVRGSLGLVFIIVVIDLLGFAIVLPLLPRYAERFQAGGATIGLLFSSYSLMQFLFAPLWGRLSDRVGRRPALLAGLIGSVLCYGLFGVATIYESLSLMFISRLGAGVAGATISAAQAYIADSTDLRNRAKGMALIGAAFGIGFTVGPILGSIALPRAVMPGEVEPLNSLPGFLAAGLSLLALIVAWLKLPESLQPGAAHERRTWLDIRALREVMHTPSIAMLLALFFLCVFAFAQFETTLSRLTEASFHLSDRSNFYIFTYIGLILTVVQGGIVRRIAPRVGETWLLNVGTLLLGAGLWLIGMVANTGSLVGLLLAIPIVVSGFAFITPSVHALVSRRSDPGRQGEVLGLNQSASAMARILGPFCGNVVFEYGVALPYVASALLVVPCVVMAVISARGGRDWSPAEGGGFDTVELERPQG